MDYVRAHTSVPVPEVLEVHYGNDANDDSWIIMQKLPGVQLDAAWPDMDDEVKKEATRQLKSHLNQLHQLRPPTDGWIGAVSRGPAFDHRLSNNKSTCGPFASVAEFHDFLAAPVRLCPRPEWFEKFRSQLDDIYGAHFAHADLSWENILVDPATGNVIGVLDWEMAGVWPEWWEFRKALYGLRYKSWWMELVGEIMTDYSKEADVDVDLGDVLTRTYTATPRKRVTLFQQVSPWMRLPGSRPVPTPHSRILA